jgi:hypothetical protein
MGCYDLWLSWPRTGLTNFWHACPKWHAEKFPWQAAFIAVPFCFFYFARPESLYCEEHVHTYTYLTLYRLYMNYRCYQITMRVKHFYTNRERWEVLTGYISLRCQSGGDWVNTWHWAEHFTAFLSNRQYWRPQVLPRFLAYSTPESGLY